MRDSEPVLSLSLFLSGRRRELHAAVAAEAFVVPRAAAALSLVLSLSRGRTATHCSRCSDEVGRHVARAEIRVRAHVLELVARHRARDARS